ncbi:MAG TPA: hypothetical protein VGW75_03760 [Solirubrobacteraceae bacterium]|jgi:Tol biopolymer transport system component|nr:hypothetical protein [Solirubrobacteraceae bacterium]
MRLVTVSALTALAALAATAPPAAATLAFQRAATGEIVVANDDGSSPRVIARGQFPVVSPDGRRVAFLAATSGVRGRIRVIGVHGGRPWTAVRRGVVVRARAAIWSPGGRRLVAAADRGADGYVVSALTRRRRPIRFAGDFSGATFSPDGRTLVVQRLSISFMRADLVAIDLRGHRRRTVRGRSLPVWGAGGVAWRNADATYKDPGTFAAIAVSRTLTGPAREVLRGGPALDAPVAWSADGSRLLVADGQSGQMQALILKPSTGASQTLPAAFASSTDAPAIAALSRDGQLVLGEAGGDVITEDLSGAITVLAAGATTPTWSR